MTVLTQKMHNVHGGNISTTPSSVVLGAFNNGDDGSGLNVPNNVGVMYQTNAGSMYLNIHNNISSLDCDIGFAEFTLNVIVPAGAKVKVKYQFDVTVFKSADSSDGSSHYCSEFFHYGTGVNGDGANPVDISTQSFEPSGGGGANSKIRLDGGLPTYVFGCSISGNDGSLNANHAKSTYPNHGSSQTGCEPVKQGAYTTTEITYENTSSTSKSYKEYFGFMGGTSIASGSCHMLDAQVNITTVQVELERIAKPTVSGQDSYTYDNTDKTFNISGIDATKTKLIKVTKTGLDGVDSTIYEYDYDSDAVVSGANPLTSGQCKFKEAGIYTLTFRPKSAVWDDSVSSPNTSHYDLKLYIFPKKVNKPTVATADVSGKAYSGAAQTFTLAMTGGITASNWSDNIGIEASKGGNLPTGVIDNANGSFTVTDAGEYDVYLTLKDEKNTCWGDKTYSKTTWSGSGAGGTAQVTLKVNPFELTVASSCDKVDSSSKWAWNMGDEATVTLTVSGFKLATDTTEVDPKKVTLNYYYRLGSGADSPVSASEETYDPATKTITAKIKMPTTLAQGSYTFGVAPDENAGAGKNYTVKKSIVEKAFTISAKAFDPASLKWTYSVDGVTDETKLLADGGKFRYELKSDGTAKVYNPLILLKNDSYDHTDKIAIDSVGYTGDTDKSDVKSYKTTVELKVIDSEIKFANPTNNSNIVVAADGLSATVTINWEIEKGTFDLSGVKWEYWYKDNNGGEHSGDYSSDLEYNDGLYIYVRVKADSLPEGLTLSSGYTDVVPPNQTYGDRQRNVGTYNLTFDALNDFDYDSSSFNAPDATASTLKLEWKIVPKKIVAKFKLTKRSYTNANGSGSYYIRELDLSGMGCPDSFKSYFTLKYYDSTDTEVSLADIDTAADATNEKTYTVKAFIDTSVAAAKNYLIVDAAGNTPTTTFKTGSSNSPASFTIDGKDGSSPISLTYDGKPQFGGSLIGVKADDGTVITDYTVTYYKGATPVAGNELPDGELPTDVGTYCVEITLTGSAESIYILQDSYYTVTIEKQELTVTVDGSDGSQSIELKYDGKPHFNKISLKGEDGSELADGLYTVKYYDVAGNELADGVVPENAGEYRAVIALAGGAVGNYDLSADTFVLKIEKQDVVVTVDGSDGSQPVELTYDGKPHFNKISLKGEDGNELDASLYTVKYYDGEGNALADGAVPENAGEYRAVIALAVGAVGNYDLSADTFVLKIEKIGIALPTVGEIVFSNSFINLAEKLGGSYLEYNDVIELGGVYDGVKNAGSYTATLTLTNKNYYWKPETGAQLNSRKVLFEGESATITGDGSVATLDWAVLPYVLKADKWDMSGKEGAVYNLPAELTEGLDISVNYNYFMDKASDALESGSELAKGTQYFVKAELMGADARNFVFADTGTTTSDFAEYSIPAGVLSNVYGFLKTNWLWFVIGAAILLFLIILICIIASAKKKKKRRLAEEKAERERKEEERERKEEERERREEERRREEREERMARMNQQQAMPQYIPQPMPQYMPQPQPQYAPQPMPQAQPMAMGGGSSNEIAELRAEMAAMKATQDMAKELALRAEMTARESAMRAEQNAVLRSDVNALRGGEQVGGISVDAMTDIMTAALKNVLASATQQVIASQPVQQAQLTEGTGNAPATQVPPDAVMTTVTTTKIDTTKKNAQGTARPVVRNYVAPMPVDDGRVFDVGGFYKPADPLTDISFDNEDKKD